MCGDAFAAMNVLDYPSGETAPNESWEVWYE